MSIEQKISPLVQNMFPAFYAEEGQSFIAFVKAYYEFLEQNFQLLTLDNNTNFNIGDTIIQGSVIGTIVNYVNSDILVLVSGLETFKCVTMCSDLTPITSSSGGTAIIKHGGMSRRLGAIFLSRNLQNIRDIDTTMDIFLTNFKEKYLSNIEFDTATNKKLLVKNSFDLYRSKGTSRSIDLFFRLMYGINSSVYYPGEDLFKLSAGEWFKPQYLEIACVGDFSFRAVQLIGKLVTGVTSGAKAFVEKYVKHKLQNGFSHVLYVTNVTGTFVPGELIKNDVVYSDSPKILGSLAALENIQTLSSNFNIGDIVSVQSTNGLNGLAKVTSTNDSTGSVIFNLLDSGWGYSVNVGNTDPTFLADHSQTIVSSNILFVSSLSTGNVISSISVANSGSSYNNTDVITLVSPYTNALARPITSPTGSVTSIVLTNPGTGFFTAPSSILISNSSGGSSNGSGLAYGITYDNPVRTFGYLQKVVQRKADIAFNTATVSSAWGSNVAVLISNGSSIIGSGAIIAFDNLTSNTGTASLLLDNNFMVAANNKIILTSNSQVSANISSYSDVSATGRLINIPSSATLSVDSASNLYFNLNVGDIIYQKTSSGQLISSASVAETVTTKGLVVVNNIQGPFILGQNVYSANTLLNASLLDYKVALGIYQVNNAFTTTDITPSAKIIIPYAGLNASLNTIAGGTDAKYNVSTISNYETVSLNTDLIANSSIYKSRINATQYNLPASPTANISSVISSSLTYKNFVLGEIFGLGFIDPGTNYSEDPILLTYQPYTSGYAYKDYIFTLSNINGSFSTSEYVQQIDNANNVIAKGIIKSISGSTMHVKRIQFNNNFNSNVQIIGSVTGTTANISLISDQTSGNIGWNANVESSVFTANGVITGLSVSDSGFGFIGGQEATFSLDGRTGTATIINHGLGIGSGRYRNSKGFVSDLSKIQDGSYYQEYSYDVISRIPLERYSDMFKKVMHTAGTKFFGTILVDSINEVSVTIANSQIEFTDPYVIQDRILENVQERSSIEIEIRS